MGRERKKMIQSSISILQTDGKEGGKEWNGMGGNEQSGREMEMEGGLIYRFVYYLCDGEAGVEAVNLLIRRSTSALSRFN